MPWMPRNRKQEWSNRMPTIQNGEDCDCVSTFEHSDSYAFRITVVSIRQRTDKMCYFYLLCVFYPELF